MRTIEEIKSDIQNRAMGGDIYTKSESLVLSFQSELIVAQDAEIERLRQQCEWQPIETAPINTWILVLDKQPSPLSGPVSAYQSLRRIVDKKYEWITDGDLEIEPTHWMPIPPLPQAKKKKEESHE